MPTPRLIHPIYITIAPLDNDAQTMDDAAREPIHGARATTTIRVQAQVTYDKKDEPQYEITGNNPSDAGHVCFTPAGLARAGYTPKTGDRITLIGDRTPADLYLTGSVPQAHYDRRGAGLVKWNFADRSPVKQ